MCSDCLFSQHSRQDVAPFLTSMHPHHPSAFPNASTIQISHGIFNEIQGNSYTNYYSSYNVSACHRCPSAARISDKDLVPRSWPAQCTPTFCLPPQVQAFSNSDYNSGLFPILENTLELIKHCVASPNGTTSVFHRLSPDVDDLLRLVTLSSAVYEACAGPTSVGRLLHTAIESRLSTCNRRLIALHQEMLELPYRSVPLVHLVCQTLYQWWTTNEPEEITSIRRQIHAEATALGEWLSCVWS
jgi:hypothetical protein